MNNEISDKMKMIAGDTKPRLSEAQRQKLAAAYMQLFIGLAAANWARGNKSLGAAWYETLNQIKAMLGARDKNNPATEYLLQTFAAHNVQISREAMTNPNKDAQLELADAKRDEWNKNANKRVGDAMKDINEITGKFKTQEHTKEQDATSRDPQKFDEARQKLIQRQQMLMAIWAQQKQNVNAA